MKNSVWREYQTGVQRIEKLSGRAPHDEIMQTILERSKWLCRWCSTVQLAGERCEKCGMPRPLPEIE